jgi:hypothetical protein
MDMGTALIVLGMTALVVGGLLVAVVRQPKAERQARSGILRASVALRRARARHASLIRRAERRVARVEREHSSTLAALDRRIVALEDPRGRQRDSLGPVTLYELRIVTPAGEVALDGVEATFDTVGGLSEKKRTTLTRLAVGGVFLGPLGAILALGFPKRTKVDTRELYLLIEAGPASCVVKVKPDDGARVRAFAVQINASAAAVAARRSAIAADLAETRRLLANVREDHGKLDAARAELGEARTDGDALAAIGRAEAELAAARDRLAGTQRSP